MKLAKFLTGGLIFLGIIIGTFQLILPLPQPQQFPLSVPFDGAVVVDGNRLDLTFGKDTIIKRDETIGRRHSSLLLVTFDSRSQKIIMWDIEEPHYVSWNDFKLDNPWNELYFIGELEYFGQDQFMAVPRRNFLPVKALFFSGIVLGSLIIYKEKIKKAR